eukprot:15323986-Ditylum_brightwellii.AAC.1
MITSAVLSSNKYRSERKRKNTDLNVWKNKKPSGFHQRETTGVNINTYLHLYGTGLDKRQEMNLERMQPEQDDEEDESNEEDNDETNEEEKDVENMSSTKVWYFKLQKWIDQVRDASAALIRILGTYLSLD